MTFALAGMNKIPLLLLLLLLLLLMHAALVPTVRIALLPRCAFSLVTVNSPLPISFPTNSLVCKLLGDPHPRPEH